MVRGVWRSSLGPVMDFVKIAPRPSCSPRCPVLRVPALAFVRAVALHFVQPLANATVRLGLCRRDYT